MRISIAVRSVPLWMVVLPAYLAAQTETSSGAQPYVSVLIAFAVSWIMVAAWVARIGSKVNRLLDQAEEMDD